MAVTAHDEGFFAVAMLAEQVRCTITIEVGDMELAAVV